MTDFWLGSVYAGYLALTLESQKPIISIFLTVGALSSFLTKFWTKFFEHGFVNAGKTIQGTPMQIWKSAYMF